MNNSVKNIIGEHGALLNNGQSSLYNKFYDETLETDLYGIIEESNGFIVNDRSGYQERPIHHGAYGSFSSNAIFRAVPVDLTSGFLYEIDFQIDSDATCEIITVNIDASHSSLCYYDSVIKDISILWGNSGSRIPLGLPIVIGQRHKLLVEMVNDGFFHITFDGVSLPDVATTNESPTAKNYLVQIGGFLGKYLTGRIYDAKLDGVFKFTFETVVGARIPNLALNYDLWSITGDLSGFVNKSMDSPTSFNRHGYNNYLIGNDSISQKFEIDHYADSNTEIDLYGLLGYYSGNFPEGLVGSDDLSSHKFYIARNQYYWEAGFGDSSASSAAPFDYDFHKFTLNSNGLYIDDVLAIPLSGTFTGTSTNKIEVFFVTNINASFTTPFMANRVTIKQSGVIVSDFYSTEDGTLKDSLSTTEISPSSAFEIKRIHAKNPSPTNGASFSDYIAYCQTLTDLFDQPLMNFGKAKQNCDVRDSYILSVTDGNSLVLDNATTALVSNKIGTALVSKGSNTTFLLTTGTLEHLELEDGSVYKFSEGEGGRVYDCSGNGNHGTITGDIQSIWSLSDTTRPDNLLDGFSKSGNIFIPRDNSSRLFDVTGGVLQVPTSRAISTCESKLYLKYSSPDTFIPSSEHAVNPLYTANGSIRGIATKFLYANNEGLNILFSDMWSKEDDRSRIRLHNRSLSGIRISEEIHEEYAIVNALNYIKDSESVQIKVIDGNKLANYKGGTGFPEDDIVPVSEDIFYLQSSGIEYIDTGLTHFDINGADEFEVIYSPLSGGTGYKYAAGCLDTNGSAIERIYIGAWNAVTPPRHASGWADTFYGDITEINFVYGNFVKSRVEGPNGKLFVNENQETSAIANVATLSISPKIILFGRFDVSELGGGVPNLSLCKIISMRLAKNGIDLFNGKAVAQGSVLEEGAVPAPSNCFYDFVSKTYKENVGAGSFGVGTYQYDGTLPVDPSSQIADLSSIGFDALAMMKIGQFIYISFKNEEIRKYDLDFNYISTVLTGMAWVHGMCTDGTNIFISVDPTKSFSYASVLKKYDMSFNFISENTSPGSYCTTLRYDSTDGFIYGGYGNSFLRKFNKATLSFVEYLSTGVTTGSFELFNDVFVFYSGITPSMITSKSKSDIAGLPIFVQNITSSQFLATDIVYDDFNKRFIFLSTAGLVRESKIGL